MYPDGAEIANLSLRNGFTELGMQSIVKGETVSQFRNRLLLAGGAQSPELGMSRSEIARYSVARAIEGAISNRDRRPDGFEGVISDELGKRFGEPSGPHRFLLPIDVLKHHVLQSLRTRADIVGTTTAGGYLVETENAGFVQLALARRIFGILGVQVLDGLVGNVNVPVFKSAGSQTDLGSETTQANTASQAFGQVALTPRDEVAYFETSRLLLKQMAPSTHAYLLNGMLNSFAARLEYLAIRGTGISGEPTGLLNAAGTNSVNGSSLALSGLLSMQTDTGDRLGPNGAYIAAQSVASLLAARQKASGTSSFLWEGSAYQGIVAGYPGLATSNVPASTLAFGNWDMALFAGWGGPIEIEVNPVTNFLAGVVGMRIMHAVDFALLDPAAFSISTGSTGVS